MNESKAMDMYNAGGNVPFSSSAGFNNVLLSNPKTGFRAVHHRYASLPIIVADITGLNRKQYKLPNQLSVQHRCTAGLGAKSDTVAVVCG